MPLEFRILGPLEALAGGVPLNLGGRRQRAVLALLLAQAGEVVSVDRLIDGVWDEAPPETAINLVQGYVSQLRKAIGAETIVTRGSGYAVVVPRGALDLERFEALLAAAAVDEAGDREGARERLREALALWRGPALVDLAELPVPAAIAARLDELRLLALERRIAADVDCGRAAEAVSELEGLIAEHPLRERIWALQMLALYRCGRQADALAAYRQARSALVDELGIEPGAELSELHDAILRHDPALDQTATPAPRSGARARLILLAALNPDSAPALTELGAPLAEHPDDEVVLVATVPGAAELPAAVEDLRRLGGRREGAVTIRTAGFTSLAPGADLARFASEQNADLLMFDAPKGLLEETTVVTLLENCPCDVAVAIGGAIGEGSILVPFSNVDHDWAAVELGAWMARALDRGLLLAGPSTGSSGRDASRMLASASLALQRAVGVAAEPVIVETSAAALLATAAGAGAVVMGLTERWRRDGLGPVRTALATESGCATLFVRRGLRPGGLAPRTGQTRFTWTLAPAD